MTSVGERGISWGGETSIRGDINLGGGRCPLVEGHKGESPPYT